MFAVRTTKNIISLNRRKVHCFGMNFRLFMEIHIIHQFPFGDTLCMVVPENSQADTQFSA